MNEDAFEQLQAANPLPEDPPPPPIATLMERVDRLEQPEPPEPKRRGPKKRATFRLALIAVGAVAVTALALTHSTTVTPTSDSASTAVAPEHELAVAGQLSPNEYQDLKESSHAFVSAEQVARQKAQAAAVDPAATANGLAWSQMGPYNIGGRLSGMIWYLRAVSVGTSWPAPTRNRAGLRPTRHLSRRDRTDRLRRTAARTGPTCGRTRTPRRWARSRSRPTVTCGPARVRPTRPAAA